MRASISSTALLLLLLVCTCAVAQIFDQRPCEEKCSESADWFQHPVLFCGTDGITRTDNVCPTGGGVVMCLIKNFTEGVQYPGQCGCPNGCMAMVTQGRCSNAECSCLTGWTGRDCSEAAVDCAGGQRCSSHGVCTEVNGVPACVCDDGWAGRDCSISFHGAGPLPRVVETFPSTQYTSQDKYGDAHPVFNTSDLAQIRITLSEEDMAFMQDPANQNTREYMRATMWFHNHEVSEVVEDVGFRLKGGISRTWAKKTWKLSFNKFEKGRKWKGLKKLALKGMSFEPSFMRESTSADVLYSVNVPVSRYSYAQVNINGLDFGLAIMLEHIDDRFLKSRFGNADGKLYKCFGTLEYLGPDEEAYRTAEEHGRVFYDPKSDAAEEGDFSELVNFITVLNKAPPETFVEEIEEIFDVDMFLRVWAMEVATGQSDGTLNGNNYYLYLDPEVQRFRYIRHDLDLSFGLFDNYGFMGLVSRDVYEWYANGRGQLLPERILQVEQYRNRFTEIMEQIVSSIMNLSSSTMKERWEIWSQQLTLPALQDSWHHLDYLWSFQHFLDSVNKTVTYPVTHPLIPSYEAMGLKEWVVGREKHTLMQLDG